ncbi:MAG: L-aspartate oxidase [Fimbriimonadaceae bacterium]|jgi:L-aspartate oxidase|nr:L-aspartate oxidase [Fimbriimonadaceae bacterium]
MERCDYLVIGSGLAGLTFALKAAEHGSVTVLTKSEITESNTNWAQGGIAAAVGESDSWELHEEDTLIAGAGLCDPCAVRFLVQQAPEAIEWLQQLGARFDLLGSNELDLGREGGHSRHRIVHHADKTGWEVERAVSEAVRGHKGIRVYENCFVTHLLMNQGRCVGAGALLDEIGQRDFLARATLLATGGCGKLYSNTTNPRVATGDGIALAHSVGAEIRNMEFMQFHPTTLYHPQLSSFLITEAVRGAGGTLRDHTGRRFMYDYDSRLELAPRDVVARAIENQIQKLDTWCVYLDMTHLDVREIQKEFPTIWTKLREIGIEIEKTWIPITPAQHYSCGGVVTDLSGRTTLPGLFASGEVTCTGVHGANRLASNSLLEAMVFSTSAADAVRDEPEPAVERDSIALPKSISESESVRIRHALQRAMSHHVGIFRRTAGLEEVLEKIRGWHEDYEKAPPASFSSYSRECFNLLVTAQLVVSGALARKENVGLHYNADLVQP